MRQPQPFFRRQTRTWYLQLGSRQVNLGPDKKLAWERYHELMARREAETNQPASVAELFDIYLEWCSNHRSAGTYRNHRRYLRSFIAHLGKRFPSQRLRPFHVTQWLDNNRDWTDTTKNDAVSIVQRPINWAVKQGRIDRSPILQVEDKPPRRRREVAYTPAQWAEIRAAVNDRQFLDFITFLWETGCRPFEARMLEARHVDLARELIDLPSSEAKGKKNARVIFLTGTSLEIVGRGCERFSTGPIFRNSRGNPWTKDAVKYRFGRLREKVGISVLCAYGFRHSYATEGLKNGVDSICLAALVGQV